jgi:hypothetical protein
MKNNLLPRSESEKRPPAHKRAKHIFCVEGNAKKSKESTQNKRVERKENPARFKRSKTKQRTAKESKQE